MVSFAPPISSSLASSSSSSFPLNNLLKDRLSSRSPWFNSEILLNSCSSHEEWARTSPAHEWRCASRLYSERTGIRCVFPEVPQHSPGSRTLPCRQQLSGRIRCRRQRQSRCPPKRGRGGRWGLSRVVTPPDTRETFISWFNSGPLRGMRN